MCPEGVAPYNQRQTWVPSPPGRHQRQCEFDLDLEGGPGNLEKFKQNGKTLHGVMVCDVPPAKNTKHVMPRDHK
jgi:hypothetical protein